MDAGTQRYVGLDLAKRTLEVRILSDEKKECLRKSGVRTDEKGRKQLSKLLKQTDIVAMEACSYAFMLSKYLEQEVGCTVYVLNPGRLQMIWRSTRKTDKDDAYKIANFIQRYPQEELPLVHVPHEKDEELRNCVSLKMYLTKQRTRSINRLHAVYVQAGITTLKKSNLQNPEKRVLQQQGLKGTRKVCAEILEEEIRVTETQLKRIEEEIKNRVAKNELTPYLMSIPGVGIGLAAAFLAYIGDGSRFSKSSEVANYAGLVPKIDSSGETSHYGHITKAGCRALRGTIIQSVWSLTQCKSGGGSLQEKFFMLNERMSKTKSAVAIARKMITLMWVLVKRKHLYTGCTRSVLESKFRRYNVHFEEWESLSA